MEVTTITSNSEELTPADISSTTVVLDQLTDPAIANQEVQLLVLTIHYETIHILDQRSLS